MSELLQSLGNELHKIQASRRAIEEKIRLLNKELEESDKEQELLYEKVHTEEDRIRKEKYDAFQKECAEFLEKSLKVKPFWDEYVVIGRQSVKMNGIALFICDYDSVRVLSSLYADGNSQFHKIVNETKARMVSGCTGNFIEVKKEDLFRVITNLF